MNVCLRTFEKRSVLQIQGDMFDEAPFLMKNSLQHSNLPKPLDNLPYRTQRSNINSTLLNLGHLLMQFSVNQHQANCQSYSQLSDLIPSIWNLFSESTSKFTLIQLYIPSTLIPHPQDPFPEHSPGNCRQNHAILFLCIIPPHGQY